MHMGVNQTGMAPIFRPETGYPYHPHTDIEKRQLFLRSYQFCRKKSFSERIKGSLFRVKRVVWVRLRSAIKIRKMVWFRFKNGLFYGTRKKRFIRLYSPVNGTNNTFRSLFW